MASRIVRRIAGHIRRLRLGEPPDDLKIDRTHSGRHQRNIGAWSWALIAEQGPFRLGEIGSQYTAAEIAACRDVTAQTNRFGQTSLDPCCGNKNEVGDYCDPCFDRLRKEARARREALPSEEE